MTPFCRIYYLRRLSLGFFTLLFLRLFHAQGKIQKNTENSGSGNTGHLNAEEGDIASKGIIAADTDHHDGSDYRNIF